MLFRSTRGIFFKDDGTKMFIVGTTNDRVFEYSLSTPWQVNTATNIAAANLAINTGDSGALSAITFKTDGTIVYTLGTTTDRVYAHNLGTAWNVATAGYSINFVRV